MSARCPAASTSASWRSTRGKANQAFRIALRNVIDFLSHRAGLTRLDAHGLASMAVDFRIAQVMDVDQGVHAMIPKEIFARELRKTCE